ncbi:PPOX class F420-dependent oxidoreductase [Streptomyces sp. NPDC051976]|uniref:PPOX class F420-dependent oxidoreductase n=1 Tax=Streptomyces sp. NPDC051976 TaxID=3154947 RepID=UPI00343BB875
MAALSEQARALIDGKNFATVATIQPDGRPQLSVVWVKRDGDEVLFSTLEGRRKHLNLVRDPRITLLVYPADNPYAYLEVRGTATLVSENAPELIEELSQKYTGEPFRKEGPEAVRVIVRVAADRVVEHG